MRKTKSVTFCSGDVVQYGQFSYASENEKIQMVRDRIAQGLTYVDISNIYQITESRVEHFVRLDKIRERTRNFLINIRERLRQGKSRSEISSDLSISEANVNMLIKRHRDLVYPL